MEVSEIINNYLAYCNRQASLTEEQKSTLGEILARYDPEKMTGEDRQALRAELIQAGIPRTGEAGRVLKEAGFMLPPPEVMDPAGPTSGSPPEAARDKSSGLLELIDQVKSGRIDEDEFISLLLDYAEANSPVSPGRVIDKSV